MIEHRIIYISFITDTVLHWYILRPSYLSTLESVIFTKFEKSIGQHYYSIQLNIISLHIIIIICYSNSLSLRID